MSSKRLVAHSPVAFNYYRDRLSLSADLLCQKTTIPIAKIQKAEQESQVFTFNQLQKLAKVLLVPEFYLMTDKIQEIDIPEYVDHRNRIDQVMSNEDEYSLNKVIHNAVISRENLEYTYDCLDVEPEPFTLILSGNDAEGDAKAIRDFLDVEQENLTLAGSEGYKTWRLLIERKDVLVLEIGREKIGSEGLSLYYPTLPIIAILSSNQSNSRKLFTMIHELVHLGLRQSSIDGQLLHADESIERYCNQVAGYVLVPQGVLDTYQYDLSISENVDNIRKVTKVSRWAIAIQLKLVGIITQSQLDNYIQELEISQSSGGFGISGKKYTAFNKFGQVYLQQVLSAVWDNSISISSAIDMLNLNDVTDLDYLEQKVFS